MENLLSKFFSEISYIAFIPLLVITFKNIIDNRNLSDIEKILMTNWKRFKIDLSNYGVYNFVLLTIGILYIAFSNPSSLDNVFPSISVGLLAFAIVWLIMTIAFIVLSNTITWIDHNLTSNNEFFITLEEVEWKIIKMKNETSMLVRKDNRYMFINDWNHKVISSQPKDSIPLKKIYMLFPNTKILNKIIFPIIFVLSLVGFISCFFIKNLMMFPLFFLSAFLLLTVAMIWVDHYLYSKFNQQS
ncbi:hypothetical protein [Lysinibacillus parviboronicapiens]|uniref:hypothetical protein n=1 Tax=Lysinibacillus parviboronicapiens TaxID=436516 RepID=UPI000D36A6CF|nr:hypothetical protein [Lysinibacillus parviboronicapiens]